MYSEMNYMKPLTICFWDNQWKSFYICFKCNTILCAKYT